MLQEYSKSSYGWVVPVAVMADAEAWKKAGSWPLVRDMLMPPAVFMAVIVTLGLPPNPGGGGTKADPCVHANAGAIL
jgi:hypothetical protein